MFLCLFLKQKKTENDFIVAWKAYYRSEYISDMSAMSQLGRSASWGLDIQNINEIDFSKRVCDGG